MTYRYRDHVLGQLLDRPVWWEARGQAALWGEPVTHEADLVTHRRAGPLEARLCRREAARTAFGWYLWFWWQWLLAWGPGWYGECAALAAMEGR